MKEIEMTFVTAGPDKPMPATGRACMAESIRLLRQADEENSDLPRQANLIAAAQTWAMLAAFVEDEVEFAHDPQISAAMSRSVLTLAPVPPSVPDVPESEVTIWKNAALREDLATVLSQITPGLVEHHAEYETASPEVRGYLRGWEDHKEQSQVALALSGYIDLVQAEDEPAGQYETGQA